MATGRVPTTANSPLTAKGDLFTYSTAPARLAVGLDGETIVADSSTSTGLRYQPNFAAGKNKIINGDFSNWQRSTSVTVTTEDYLAPDRYRSVYVAGGATTTWSRQTFTPGTAPVAGYEGQYFSRIASTSGSGTTVIGISQRIENVQTFAGQTATISFWAKADSARTATILISQIFGTGGSTGVNVYVTTQALTTSWARYSFTVAMDSIAGKTIGTGSYVVAYIYYNTGAASGSPQLDIWGVQFEAGSVATAFQTATGTIQGELAACQRYYFRYTNTGAFEDFGFGNARSTTAADLVIKTPITMRVNPTSIDYANLNVLNNYSGSPIAVTSASLASGRASTNCPIVYVDVASGLTASESFYLISGSSGGASYIGFSSEL